ncbi:MAG: hypothetical protein CH6_2837 [Candidatus Kapaibacterium sp.]|nr:MAG: hypothetical protein CH6_2837 [Candidatus Kapabacteria bacterium]
MQNHKCNCNCNENHNQKILDLNTLTLTVLCGCKINSDNNSDEISTFEPITEENLNKNS